MKEVTFQRARESARPRGALYESRAKKLLPAGALLWAWDPPVRWDRRTMSQSRHVDVTRCHGMYTGCRKEIAKDRDNVAS